MAPWSLNAIIARHSIRLLTTIVVLCVAAPLLVMLLFLGHQHFRSKKAEVSSQVLETARAFGDKHGDMLLHARTLLDTLARYPGLTTNTPEQIRDQFVKTVAANPQYVYLTLAGPDGYLLSSSSSRDSSINFSESGTFCVSQDISKLNISARMGLY